VSELTLKAGDEDPTVQPEDTGLASWWYERDQSRSALKDRPKTGSGLPDKPRIDSHSPDKPKTDRGTESSSQTKSPNPYTMGL
jgi:hypothetical protein